MRAHSPCPQGGTGRGQQPTAEAWTQQPWDSNPGLGTHPRPRQPSLRWTSLCRSPSSRERSSGEKESGSSTACRKGEMSAAATEEPPAPNRARNRPGFLAPPPPAGMSALTVQKRSLQGRSRSGEEWPKLVAEESQESMTRPPMRDSSPPVASRTPHSIPGLEPHTHHRQCHAVDLMLVFGLVLPEGTVPGQKRTKAKVTEQEWGN